jgi:hypothetical protein
MKQVSGSKAGGGFNSNKIVRSQNPKVEPKAYAMSPAGASQLGTALGNHATTSNRKVLKGAAVPLQSGPGYEAKGPRPGVAGPGGGRTVYRSGGQGAHGSNPGEKPQVARQIIEAAGQPRVTK